MINLSAARFGLWFRPPVGPGIPLIGSCDIMPTYQLDSNTGTLPELGIGGLSTIGVSSNYMSYSVNGRQVNAAGTTTAGSNGGALGTGLMTTPVPVGIKFDPNGAGSYDNNDYIGTTYPRYESYGFLVNNNTYIGGSNDVLPFPSNKPNLTETQASTRSYDLSSNSLKHVVVKRGNLQVGYVVVQYQTYPGEPVIRMKMSYYNTTSSLVSLRAFRGVKPFMFGSVPPKIRHSSELITANYFSDRIMGIYCPGNGFMHNCASADPGATNNTLINLQSNTVTGSAMYAVWTFDNVPSGRIRSVCCYYIFGRTLSDITNSIG